MSEGDLLAVWLTLRLAASTTAILLLLSPPLAWWLSRSQHRLRPVVEALVALPLVLPPTVLGFYLLLAFSPSYGLGAWWRDTFGAPLAFRNCFSATRSWATDRASGPGATTAPMASSLSTDAAGTFSNS